MVNITVEASEISTTFTSTIQQLQSNSNFYKASVNDTPQATIEVVIDVNRAIPKYIDLAMRPIANENALKIQKLNRELVLGYSPPVQSTRTK